MKLSSLRRHRGVNPIRRFKLVSAQVTAPNELDKAMRHECCTFRGNQFLAAVQASLETQEVSGLQCVVEPFSHEVPWAILHLSFMINRVLTAATSSEADRKILAKVPRLSISPRSKTGSWQRGALKDQQKIGGRELSKI